MPRLNAIFSLALATLSATALTATCVAQAAYPAGPGSISTTYMQTQPAPIQRAPSATNRYSKENEALDAGQTLTASHSAVGSQPTQGVYLRVGDNSSVKAVAITPERTEFRVERGLANIVVDHPQQRSEIFVDLPGGQLALLKDGLYTFNARTDTARVLHGEADAYPGASSAASVNEKPIKVKQEHEVIFNGAKAKSVEFQPYQARADMIPFLTSPGQGYTGSQGYGGGQAYGGGEGYGGYGDSPYGYGFYANPYYAYGYPGLWGDPYWNYGYGLGFGYGGFGYGLGFGYGGYYGGRGYGGRGGYYGGHGFSGGHGGFSGGHGGFSGGGSRGGGGGGRR
jgi:hypothetical protein